MPFFSHLDNISLQYTLIEIIHHYFCILCWICVQYDPVTVAESGPGHQRNQKNVPAWHNMCLVSVVTALAGHFQ